MNWLEVAAITVLLLGIGAGGILVAQRPSFWFGLATVMFKAGAPHIFAYLTKRMRPDQEQAFRDCVRRGGEWDHIRKRCKQ